ncbi:MAG: class I SAM-dependent methyltransferase [Oscillospiraceae bacterium]|nr:class I SAM-dependent methyltransferase [Oscillospiraceae bacterium]
MRLFSLDKRLSKCAEFLEEKCRVADIGADHSKLLIWLALKNKISYGIACDINKFSIELSTRNIQKYKIGNLVTSRYSDGFLNISESEVDSIVIAGLGGETISKILKKCPWKNKCGKNYIFQPMTSEIELRIFLASNDFEIEKEEIVESHGKIYTIMKVSFNVNKVNYDFAYQFLDKITPNELSARYVRNQIKYINEKLIGMILNNKNDEIINFRKILSYLNNFLKNCIIN